MSGCSRSRLSTRRWGGTTERMGSVRENKVPSTARASAPRRSTPPRWSRRDSSRALCTPRAFTCAARGAGRPRASTERRARACSTLSRSTTARRASTTGALQQASACCRANASAVRLPAAATMTASWPRRAQVRRASSNALPRPGRFLTSRRTAAMGAAEARTSRGTGSAPGACNKRDSASKRSAASSWRRLTACTCSMGSWRWASSTRMPGRTPAARASRVASTSGVTERMRKSPSSGSTTTAHGAAAPLPAGRRASSRGRWGKATAATAMLEGRAAMAHLGNSRLMIDLC